jgi:uncharacterized protein YndB with AHSA1/START domain
MTPVGKTKDAGWEIGVSRTVPFGAEAVWRLLTSERGTDIWLGAGASLVDEKGAPYETGDGTTGEVRSFRPLDRIRLTWQPPGWDHESTVQVAIRGDASKTMIRFHQERLADAAERERQRTHWTGVMDQIVAELGAAATDP